MATLSQSNQTEARQEEFSRYFNRPPRLQPQMPVGEVEIPGPATMEENYADGPIWARILPMIMMMIPTLLYAVVLLAMNPGNQSSMVMLVARIGGPLVILVITFVFGRRVLNYSEEMRSQEQEAKQKLQRHNFEERLDQIREVLERNHTIQRSIAERINPSIPELTQRLPKMKDKLLIFPDKRLWERRPVDPDFLCIRTGLSMQPSQVQVKYPDPLDYTAVHPWEQDYLEEAIRVGKAYQWIKHAPLLVNLRERSAISIVGSETKRLNLLRAMLMQVFVHHAPNDVMLYIIAPSDKKRVDGVRWEWARWLPHCNADWNGENGSGDLIARDEATALQVLEDLLKTLNRRRERSAESEGPEAGLPHLLVIIDEYTEDIRNHPVIANILTAPSALQVSIIFHFEHIDQVPSQCTALLRLDIPQLELWYGETGPQGQRIPPAGWDVEDLPRNFNEATNDLYQGDPNWNDIFKDPTQTSTKGVDPTRADQCSIDHARSAAMALQLVRLYTLGSEGDIPNYVGFLDMYGAGINTLEALNVKERWFNRERLENGKVPLPVPIGMEQRDKKRFFHLLEQKDGPHALLAGTTGSGKSEFLQTLVGALAVEHHPHFLSFFLIDYKGGSSFNMFKDLPHVVGVVSDLAPGIAERALIALQSEIRYRKRVFAEIRETKIKDIIDYQKLYVRYLNVRDGQTQNESGKGIPATMEPIPHLIIIIDEFAELKEALPHFMPEMSRIARVGRSLGIHLILATQRPAGSVRDEVRSNTQSYICLRVRSSDDSRDMIGQSNAAFLPNIPGRGFLKSGSNPPVMFQAGYAGDRYDPLRQNRFEVENENDPFTIYWSRHRDATEPDPGSSFQYTPRSTQVISITQTFSTAEIKKNLTPSEDREVGTVIQKLISYLKEFVATLPNYIELPQLWQALLPEEITLPRLMYRRMLEIQVESGSRLNASISEQEIAQTARKKLEALKDSDRQTEDFGEFVDDLSDSWQPYYWNAESKDFNLLFGVLDNPAERRQEVLYLNIADPEQRSHVVIYGAPSTGRTSALRTLMGSLAYFHAPWELHLHILDFGVQNGLRSFESFPHIGTYVAGSDEAKVRRLLRWISNEYRVRRDSKSELDIYQANAQAKAEKRYDQIQPLLILAIDNIAELLSQMGDSIQSEADILFQIAKDGINVGIIMLITAGNMFRDIPSPIISSISARIAFRMNEEEQMQMVVGGRPPFLSAEAPVGRSMWRGSPPLHVQMAVIGRGTGEQQGEELRQTGNKMSENALSDERWKLAHLRPHQIGDLEKELFRNNPLLTLDPADGTGFRMALGQRYDNLAAYTIELKQPASHLFIIGKNNTGRSSLLQTCLLNVAEQYSPADLIIFMVAAKTQSAKKLNELAELPHLTGEHIVSSDNLPALLPHLKSRKAVISQPDELKAVLEWMNQEFERRQQQDIENGFRVLLAIEDSEMIFVEGAERPKNDLTGLPTLVPLLNQSKWVMDGAAFGFYAAAVYTFGLSKGSLRLTQPFINAIKSQGLICVTNSHTPENPSNATVLGVDDYPKLAKKIDFSPKGRGFVFVEGGTPQVVQFAYPQQPAEEAAQIHRSWQKGS